MAQETIGSYKTSNWIQIINGGVGDGISLGMSTSKISFYDATAVTRQSIPSTVTTDTTTTTLVTAINALITIIKNLGLAA